MKQSLQQAIQDELPDANYPDFEPGDLIRVITEEEIGGQQRKRTFEGVCIARRGEGPDETFKVRKTSFGVGVERIFPIHSPLIQNVEIVRKGKVRRARLNYLEGRSSKEARIKEQRVDLDEANRVEDAEDSATVPEDETVEETPQETDTTEEAAGETGAEVDDEGSTPSEEGSADTEDESEPGDSSDSPGTAEADTVDTEDDVEADEAKESVS